MSYFVYEFRIYPTLEQEIQINKTIGCSRKVYNLLLEDCKKQIEETGKFRMKTPAQLKEEYPYLREVDSLALANAQMNLQAAWNNYYSSYQGKRKGKKVGKPKFHSKKNNKQNYTTNNINNSIRIENGKLRLPKVGLIKTVFTRKVTGKIKSVTVKRTSTNKYFVSILVEKENQPFYIDSSKEKKVLGIDYSSSDFGVYSNGEIANPPKSYRKYQKKLAKEQRILSRRSKKINGEYSKRREKQRIKVAKIHEKITNIRNDFIEKESTMIANNYDVVVVEDLNLQNISRTLHLGKSTMDNGFGRFRNKLEQKLNRRGKEFIKTPKFYPSSQLCSNCGYQNKEVKDLSVREWTCPNCNSHHDRDINAAINLAQYYINTSATDEIYAQGEDVRLVQDYESCKQSSLN